MCCSLPWKTTAATRRLLAVLFALNVLIAAVPVSAQLAPEIGFMHPAGGKAGETVEIVLGGYDWSPDMQMFVHDPRIRVELVGAPSPVLVPDPPYWFGAKGRGPAWPLVREFRARLIIPADVPPGLVRWQVANANGASPPATFQVGSLPEVRDDPASADVQVLPSLPVTVSGQIRRIEEVDRFEFRAERDGPITIELFAQRLGSLLNGMIQVHDPEGRQIVNFADSEGRDGSVTFAARAQTKYVVSLHDLDFAGDRAYTYRMSITPGPQLVSSRPAAGRRGETRSIEFTGIGIATGSAKLERVSRDVAFPQDPTLKTLSYSLETPFGKSTPLELALSDMSEQVEAVGAAETPLAELPTGITGTLETRYSADTFVVTLRKDERWRIAARSHGAVALDLELNVLGPDGKSVATIDDVPGTTDAVLSFAAAADGSYRVVVSDRSGKSGSPAANYRLSFERQPDDFAITLPTHLPIPIGTTVKLPIKVTRDGGFKGPVSLAIQGLPEGVKAGAELVIPADKNELALDLISAADGPAIASLVTVTATAEVNGKPVARDGGRVLVATTMKPRFKITPEGLDDVRKVSRGASYRFPLLIERLEGYQGDITLEMTAKQQRHRQGLASDEMTIPPGVARYEYPIFVPEWMETTKTSRMILNGTAKVPDPRGNVRTLVQRMELRLGILPIGSLLKIVHSGEEITVVPGAELHLPLAITRVAEFRDPVRVELITEPAQAGQFTAEPVTANADQKSLDYVVRIAPNARPGEQRLTIRAGTQTEQHGKVQSEATISIRISNSEPKR